MKWQERAACKDADPSIFDSELYSKVMKAKSYCDVCPVKDECLEMALSNPDWSLGTYGGLHHEERFVS